VWAIDEIWYGYATFVDIQNSYYYKFSAKGNINVSEAQNSKVGGILAPLNIGT
jgi:hypothetical protein